MMMSKRFARLVIKFSTIATCLLMMLACAEDVSNKMDVVKADTAKLIAMLEQPQANEMTILAKASSVSATIRYEKNAIAIVETKMPTALANLGYRLMVYENTSKTQKIFCHLTEPARSVWVEQLAGQPTTLSITVSISGWDKDRKTCPGKQ
jgi:hypothetical protein